MMPLCAWITMLGQLLSASPAPAYDLVIGRGRVLDPASGFDNVAWVGISRGVVQAISLEPLAGRDGQR